MPSAVSINYLKILLQFAPAQHQRSQRDRRTNTHAGQEREPVHLPRPLSHHKPQFEFPALSAVPDSHDEHGRGSEPVHFGSAGRSVQTKTCRHRTANHPETPELQQPWRRAHDVQRHHGANDSVRSGQLVRTWRFWLRDTDGWDEARFKLTQSDSSLILETRKNAKSFQFLQSNL